MPNSTSSKSKAVAKTASSAKGAAKSSLAKSRKQEGTAEMKKKKSKITEETSLVAESSDFGFSPTEIKVLRIFRDYLMTPGQMLCLGNADIDSMKTALEKMTDDGLLVPDTFKGSYSLTRAGFQAMHRVG